ncbi:TonB-dependent receptor [Sulfuricella sp.]|uniref:TonB-dependent receptor n=1 Tax=Sulfuricella sp. TaxID=2099377 RepID=UPI002B79FB4D|nr:TonB-dependent receptor [Sulfuricella sp.]HUX62578.1 TonB-dependent receptor [Sulfuricella sp.]
MKRKIARSTLAVAVYAAFAGPTQAADDAATATVLGEIRVTEGKKTDVQSRTELGTLNEYTPLAGTVVSREELETVKFVDSLRELLTRVPGVSKIRNMRIPDGGKQYTENRIDGMRTASTGTTAFLDVVNANDIERVEIIAGPGSVLNGSSAFGGTINVITRDAPKTPEVRLSQEAGAYGFYRTDLWGGSTLENGFGYLIDANVLENSGWREQTAESKKTVSAKLSGRIDEQSKLAFRLEYIDDDAQAPGQLTQKQFDSNWQQRAPGVTAGPSVYSRTWATYVTPSVQYQRNIGERGELTLSMLNRKKDLTTFGDAKTYGAGAGNFDNSIYDTDASETGVRAMYRHDFDLAKSTLHVGFDDISNTTDSITYNNKLTSALGSQGQFSRGAITASSLAKEKQLSPFLNYGFTPAERLRLTLGARNDEIKYSIDDRTAANKDGEKTYRKLVKKVGATYDLDRNHLLWASVAEGFLAPSVSTLLGSGGATPNMNLLPEESLTHEIGFRGFLPDQRLRYDVAVYHTTIENMIVKSGTTNLNAGKVSFKGVETGLSLATAKWLDLGLSHTYAVNTYEDYVNSGVNYSGLSYQASPRHHLNLRLTARPAAKWKVELEGDYTSRYYIDDKNSDTYQRPSLYNLRASYADGPWSFWMHALNLLDTKYAERVLVLNNTRVIDAGYHPLTLRAGVSYKF